MIKRSNGGLLLFYVCLILVKLMEVFGGLMVGKFIF